MYPRPVAVVKGSVQKQLPMDDGCSLKPLPGYIELTTEACCVTEDDSADEMRAKMPCGCAISVAGMDHMCTSVLKDNSGIFKCPNCNKEWDFFLIRHILSSIKTEQEIREISEKVDKACFNKTQEDIRQCPKCQTYCTRDFNLEWHGNRNRTVCNVCTKEHGRDFEFCWSCGQPWTGVNVYSCGNANCDGAADVLKQLATCPMKNIDGVSFPVPSCRLCPACGWLIEHTGGCPYMMCLRCPCHFCFVCLTKCVNNQFQCKPGCKLAPVQTIPDCPDATTAATTSSSAPNPPVPPRTAPSTSSSAPDPPIPPDADNVRASRADLRRRRKKRCSVM